LARLQRLIFAPEQFHPQGIVLNPDQRRYLFKVLRLQSGDRFIAMDGKGHWWMAELCDSTHAQLLEPIEIDNELGLPLNLIAAPPKGNGFETVVHCATELGVQGIYPLMSERTQNQPKQPLCHPRHGNIKHPCQHRDQMIRLGRSENHKGTDHTVPFYQQGRIIQPDGGLAYVISH